MNLLYLADVIIAVNICIVCNALFTVYRRKYYKVFSPSFHRPVFPENQPLSSYLSNTSTVKRGLTPWSDSDLFPYIENELGQPRTRLFIARIIGNDLWPLASPCRSRLNLARLISETATPDRVVLDHGNEWLAEEEGLLSLPSSNWTEEINRLDVRELWAPFRILNGTEHRLILDLLKSTNTSNLVFSVPVDVPSLAIAKNYISYLTNVALARQIVLRETVRLDEKMG